jgi:hypothetical protein
MTIQKRTLYSTLYISSDNNISDKQMNHFLLCGDTNWEYYFNKIIDNKSDYEILHNIELLEFDNQNSAEEYLSITSPDSIQDISFEKDYFGILIYT